MPMLDSLTHPTVQQLINWLHQFTDKDRRVELSDPDTGWTLKPRFNFNSERGTIEISAEYATDVIDKTPWRI